MSYSPHKWPYEEMQFSVAMFRKVRYTGVVHTQRFQKLIYLHLFTDCFMQMSPQSSELIVADFLPSTCLVYRNVVIFGHKSLH